MSSCVYFDQAAPGTGPPGLVNAPAQSLDYAKYNGSYNLSLRSKSDFNLNPQPEGFVFGAFPKSEQNRQGYYAIETDRGDLAPTAYTQVNANGPKLYQVRLQDDVRPTMKETTLYSYDGSIATVTPQQAVYSQFIPQYSNIDGKQVRIGGSTNFGLRTATEYSYIPGAGPTAINTQVIQNPDLKIGKNTKPVSDENVDGPSTFKGVVPDASKYQQYRVIAKPTTNALKLNYNLETEGSCLSDYSSLLGKNVDGLENRYTASYQIAPLFNNPLNVIWDPDNKGTIPPFYCIEKPADYAYDGFQNLPADEWINGGYNDTWVKDNSKTSTNAYILGLEKGIHNPRLEWEQGVNNFAGMSYNPYSDYNKNSTTCYGGNVPVYGQYTVNQHIQVPNSTYVTYGDPSAGNIGQSVNGIGKFDTFLRPQIKTN